MLSRFFVLVLVTAGLYGAYGVTGPRAREATPASALRQKLMDTVHAMGTKGDMVAHDDVSSIIAPLFPAGQSFAATQQVVKQYRLGQLRMFKGTQMMPNGKMYATRFSLVSGMISDVYVIIDFDFVGTNEQDMVLQTTKAFLQSTSM